MIPISKNSIWFGQAVCFSAGNGKNLVLHLYEAAIDLLSYLTLLKEQGVDYRDGNYISLGGIYQPKKKLKKYRSGCFETVSCRTQNNENHGIF